MARKIVIGSAEISENESDSTLDGCTLQCYDNPEGWSFESDSRGAATLEFEVRVRGDTPAELESRLEDLMAELRYVVGKEIKLVDVTATENFALPLENWTTFYGRYKLRKDGEGAIVQCTMTSDALGDGSDPGADGQIGVTLWTIHLAAGGLVTAQGQSMFSTLEDAAAFIDDLQSGSATLPSWMGTAFKFFDAQIETRQVGGSPLGGTGVPVHVEMRQKQTGPDATAGVMRNVKDWEYSITRVETKPFMALDGAPVGRPSKLANLSGSFQYKTQSSPDLIAGDSPGVAPKNIFKEADTDLTSLINWLTNQGAAIIEVPGARKLTPSFPNSQVSFETALMILGGPNDPTFVVWQESLTYNVESELRVLATYRGTRRASPRGGMTVTLQHKFYCESIAPQPYLTPRSPPGFWLFAGGKIPKPAKNEGGSNGPAKGTSTYVTDGETTWIRISTDEYDVVPEVPALSESRLPLSEDSFGS